MGIEWPGRIGGERSLRTKQRFDVVGASRHMAEGATPFEAWHLPSHRMLQRGLARV
jgi:hypothetical protein